jgi:hypothetical protein
MNLPGLTSSNRYFIPERDREWPHVVTALLVLSVLVVAALALVGWPRLKSTSIHYELIGLRAQVQELEQRERELVLELEQERSPQRLAERARALGLVPASPPGVVTSAPEEIVE